MSKRRRRHRKNSSKTPKWLVPAIVASGLVSLWLYKRANPGASINPMPPTTTPA